MDNKRPSDFFIYNSFKQVREDDFAHQLNDSSSSLPLHRRSASDSLALLNTSPWKQPVSNKGYIYAFQGQPSQAGTLTLPSNHEIKTEIFDQSSARLAFLNTSSSMRTDLNYGDIHASEGHSSRESMLTLPSDFNAKTEIQYDQQAKCDHEIDPRTNDPKNLKRLIANREAAQRSRLRKQKYVERIEKSHEVLQAQVKDLHAEIHSQGLEYTILRKENEALNKKLQYVEAVKAFKEAEYEAMKKEKEMLGLLIQLRQQGNI